MPNENKQDLSIELEQISLAIINTARLLPAD